MKSKFKENGKNRILAVIASAVMFCLVVLLIIVTRKTDVVAAGHYHGLSTLYHEEGTDGYYLILTQGEEDREVFDRVCNVISEYGIPKRSTPASLTFLEEHCSTLIAEHALQRLSNTSM